MRILSPVCLAIVLFAQTFDAPAGAASGPPTRYLLHSGRAPDEIDTVQIAMKVDGKLKVQQRGKSKQADMSASAAFVYRERLLQSPEGADRTIRSIRHYNTASGQIESAGFNYRPELREERRLIGVQAVAPNTTRFSPMGPLSFEELELLDIVADSLILPGLLPDDPVAVDDSWKIPDHAAAALLGLETIAENSLRSTLKNVEAEKARIVISGQIKGAARGATSTIELRVETHFDLSAKRITWFGLSMRETRSAGLVEAGFEVVARLQIKITPGGTSEHLSDAALAGLALEPSPELTRLAYQWQGGDWSLFHDRRWFVLTEGKQGAVLQFVDRGDSIAQCRVATLQQSKKALRTTLAGFQEEVKRSLAENFSSFVEAGQWHSPTNHRVFRVVAEGESSEVPIRWIHYLVIDPEGRRIVFAFVVEQELLVRFEAADRELVDSFDRPDPGVAANSAGNSLNR